MARLTERQKDNIVALYAAGGVSQKDLSIKYGVSERTIYNILKSRDGDFAEKVRRKKQDSEKKNYENILEYFEANKGKGAETISKLLDIPDELIKATPLKARIEAAELLRKMYKEAAMNAGGDDDGDERIEVVIVNNGKPQD